MTTWATRKKTLYTVIFLFIVLVIIGLPTYFLFHKKPTCFDGIKNQDERGVDCDGSCRRLCPLDYVAPISVWETFTQVVPGVYNVASLLTNPNLDVASRAATYTFKLYDGEGILITERVGQTTIPAGSKFIVFENALNTGQRVPARAVFEFKNDFDWYKGVKMLYKIDSLKLSTLQRTTLVEGRIIAQGPIVFGKSEAVAVLYDKDGNVISFSKTILDSVYPGVSYPVSFTWPTTFNTPVVKTDIFVRPL